METVAANKVLSRNDFSQRPKTQTNISILSNNILADEWGHKLKKKEESSGDQNPRYKNVPDQFLHWNYRKKLLLSEIKALNADIVCLQEVEGTIFKEELLPALKELGYDGLYQTERWIGNATFWKTTKFSHWWTDSRSKVIIIGLRILDTISDSIKDNLLMIANAHLDGFHQKTVERFNSTRSLLQQVQKHIKKLVSESTNNGDNTDKIDWIDYKLIICGDFNCSEKSGIYRLLSTGVLEHTYVDSELGLDFRYTNQTFHHPFKFKSAYNEANAHPEFTFKVEGMKPDTLDFIWYTNTNMELVSVMEVMSKDDKKDIKKTSLPNRSHPSDHLPVASIFKLL